MQEHCSSGQCCSIQGILISIQIPCSPFYSQLLVSIEIDFDFKRPQILNGHVIRSSKLRARKPDVLILVCWRSRHCSTDVGTNDLDRACDENELTCYLTENDAEVILELCFGEIGCDSSHSDFPLCARNIHSISKHIVYVQNRRVDLKRILHRSIFITIVHNASSAIAEHDVWRCRERIYPRIPKVLNQGPAHVLPAKAVIRAACCI
mmetsp:Transcript_26487/g.87000  ORF Transcript_26487/g.87000 Transcript_26487/m.87000 type:complete len:207 (-) Transcript_26487:2653-3273(-)